MNSNDYTDILVVGTGLAGLTCMLGLQSLNYNAKCIGPIHDSPSKQIDTRTTALFQGSIEFLKNLGIWEECHKEAVPLKKIRLIDNTARLIRAPEMLFEATELGLSEFGFNIPNATLSKILQKKIETNNANAFIKNKNIKEIHNQDNHITTKVEDGNILTTRLIIGADGRNSISRQTANIKTFAWSYPQTAIACNFSHKLEHQNISNEFHYPAGPCTTVPLKDRNSSLVWVETTSQASRLMELDEEHFAHELRQKLHGILGDINKIGQRASFPLSGLTAQTFAQNHIILIGEAAHVMPPIGAQGLNLGFRDIATLLDIMKKDKKSAQDLAISSILKQYNAERRTDVWSRTMAVDMLNRSLIHGFLPVKIMRSLTLNLIKNIAPLRRLIMRQGMQPDFAIPSLMKPGNSL